MCCLRAASSSSELLTGAEATPVSMLPWSELSGGILFSNDSSLQSYAFYTSHDEIVYEH